MLDLVCTLMLVGRLCFADPASPTLVIDARPSPVISGAMLKGDGWQGSIVWKTGTPQDVNRTHLTKSCDEDGRCFAYFRKCDGTTCKLLILPEGEEHPLDFHITGKDLAATKRALDTIYYLPAISDPGTPVDLASFEESAFDSPFCHHVDPDAAVPVWEPGCEYKNR